MLETRQLRAFLAVAEELHFGRAAQRLHMAQPPLSQLIRKLEDQLGARLFARTSRNVALTREGQALVEEARRILAQVRRAEELVGAMARGEAGTLRVGFVGPAMDTELPACLRRFRELRPEVELHLEERTTRELLERLGNDELDLAYVRLFGSEAENLPGLLLRRMVREPYVLALPPDHPLADRERVTLAELDGREFVSFPRAMQPALHDAVFQALAAAGARVRPVQEAERKHSVLALVAAGCGVALLPASARRGARSDVLFRDLDPASSGGLPLVELFEARRAGEGFATLNCFLELAASSLPTVL